MAEHGLVTPAVSLYNQDPVIAAIATPALLQVNIHGDWFVQWLPGQKCDTTQKLGSHRLG